MTCAWYDPMGDAAFMSALVREGVSVSEAEWISDDCGNWHLHLWTASYDQRGPRETYRRIQTAIAESQAPVALSDMKVRERGADA